MAEGQERNLRADPVPTTLRERRLHNCGRSLRPLLKLAMKVATGRGPRGKNTEINEIRNVFAREVWGAIAENLVFRDRRWIIVTAPGEMFLGLRKIDLFNICDRLTLPDRPVLLIEEDDVRWLASFFGAKHVMPKMHDLPLRLQQAVSPLFAVQPSEPRDELVGLSGRPVRR